MSTFVPIKIENAILYCIETSTWKEMAQVPLPSVFYWRDYMGMIPEDAVEGGHDKQYNPTYIGQVYVHKFGISTITIYQGVTNVTPSVTGFTAWNQSVKILCSPCKQHFKWVSADAENFHVQMAHQYPIPGGIEWDGMVTNIGRILYQGELLVGKVCGFNVGDACLFYVAGNDEKSISSYEVLVYNHPNGDSMVKY